MENKDPMRAMVYHGGAPQLKSINMPIPDPGPGQVLIRVHACGVCRTDLHIVDGELTEPKLPIVPGHEIVGTVVAAGDGVNDMKLGLRVGVPWLGSTCNQCRYCASGAENLCDRARFTGYQIDGGYAEYTVASADYCFPIPDQYSDTDAAPLLCAGLIGYRALKMVGEAERLGIYGFGAAAHIVAQVALYQRRRIFAFTRPNDTDGQAFARRMGVNWAGGSDQPPPEELDAALIFAPVGALVPAALKAVRKGGVVVCAGIHMSDIPSFSYDILWGERAIKSVANLSRRDGQEFFELAPKVPVRTEVEVFALTEANQALDKLRDGQVTGAAVLVPDRVTGEAA